MEHNGIIIAFDFDNTVFDFYNKGYTYNNVISLLKECKNLGCTLILMTCCDKDKYEFILNQLNIVELSVDYINKSPNYIPFHSNKIYYNHLLDDRAGLSSAYNILLNVKNVIKLKPKNINDARKILKQNWRDYVNE